MQQKILEAKRHSEDAIADSGIIMGWLAICSRTFYDVLIDHTRVKETYARWNNGQFLRDDLRKGFTLCDVERVLWQGE